LFIDEVMAGNEINLKFNSPLTDNATPDIIVQPIYGTVYTHSKAKNAEHGGFSFGDTNVGLVVLQPALHSGWSRLRGHLSVAASLLKALGIRSQRNSMLFGRKARSSAVPLQRRRKLAGFAKSKSKRKGVPTGTPFLFQNSFVISSLRIPRLYVDFSSYLVNRN